MNQFYAVYSRDYGSPTLAIDTILETDVVDPDLVALEFGMKHNWRREMEHQSCGLEINEDALGFLRRLDDAEPDDQAFITIHACPEECLHDDEADHLIDPTPLGRYAWVSA